MNNHVRKLDEFCEDLDADLKLPSTFKADKYRPERRGWSPFKPKIDGLTRLEMLEDYLQGRSLTWIAEKYRCSEKTANLAVIEAAKKVKKVLEVHDELVGKGYTFKSSHAIAMDLTNPPFNSMRRKEEFYPTIFVVCDAVYPRLPYCFAAYSYWPKDDELLEVVRKFALMSRRYNRAKIKQVTLDDGINLIRILPDLLKEFPEAKPQISIFHTKRYVLKSLPLKNVSDKDVWIVRSIVRKSADALLNCVSNPKHLRKWISRLRKVNDGVDGKTDEVLDKLDDLADYLTTYAERGTGVKTTNQCEGIYSMLEGRISAMRGFKSIDSLCNITNAFLVYRLFQKFPTSRYREYKYRRPIDLCFSPSPRGTWTDHCFEEAIWDE